MRLFHRDHAAIGPGVLRDCIQGGWEIGGADVQILTACSNGPQHAPYAEAGGVGIGNRNVQRHHGALNRKVGILPDRERVDGQVPALGGERNLRQILPDTVRFAT